MVKLVINYVKLIALFLIAVINMVIFIISGQRLRKKNVERNIIAIANMVQTIEKQRDMVDEN